MRNKPLGLKKVTACNLFDRGEREIRAGKGISDEDAKIRLKKWQK